MKPDEALKQMQKLDDKQQLAFMLNNINLFVNDPLLYILAVSDTLQTKLSYLKYLQLLNTQALNKRNTALLKATNEAIATAEELNI